MKQNYSERPQETWLEVLHEATRGTCIVHFNEDITEETGTGPEGEEITTYSAEHYSMETTWRAGLEEAVRENRTAWLAAAKEAEGEKPKTETEILREVRRTIEENQQASDMAIAELTMIMAEMMGGE